MDKTPWPTGLAKRGLGFDVEFHPPGIAVVRFNRPEALNAMQLGTKRDLIELMAQIQASEAVRVVVFTGSGRAFIAGDDVSGGYRVPGLISGALPPQGHDSIATYSSLRLVSQRVNTAIRELDKLTIAALNGHTVQSGLSLALACDFRIASQDAKLASATLRFGYLPDEGGHYLLVQALGVAKAMDFLMRKRSIGADEAHQIGLVHEVVEPNTLMDAALELAGELANGPQVAMRLLKRAIYQAAENSFAASLDDIAIRTAVSDHHPDVVEGLAAFRGKRPAQFNASLPHSDGNGGQQ